MYSFEMNMKDTSELWKKLCEKIMKVGDEVGKYDSYQSCPLCSFQGTGIQHPEFDHDDEPHLVDEEYDYGSWTTFCRSCGFSISYEQKTFVTGSEIPKEPPEHLKNLEAKE